MISTPSIPENPLELERQVCFALAVASRTVIAVYRPILEPLGLTHPQYLVMLALWERSPRTVKDLGNVLQLDPGTLSPLLKRDGMVRELGPDVCAVQEAVKRTLDPLNIFNPGKAGV